MSVPLLLALSVEFGLGTADLLRIIGTAPARYKVYSIPKRNGGARVIAQPSRELKDIQRFILRDTLSKLPVHDSATGYVNGRNIRENAQVHVDANNILKLDFRDFFPSITVGDWRRYAKKSNLNIPVDELSLYSRILFWGRGSYDPKCLSIGTPTSPTLSNLILFELDEKLSQAATERGVRYTRYADDITVSGERIEDLIRFEATARATVSRLKSPQLTFNEEKRGIYTNSQRRMVTGLVITPTATISLGRQRKRLISTMLHKVKIGELDPVKTGKLKGLLGFCLANEPSFVTIMRQKYGNAVVDHVLRFAIPRRLAVPPGPPRPPAGT
jgi:RNA-directed DNA polymerase